ncbi:MAG: glycosyltransferase [Peptostreptococcaceae bacterium]
MHNNDFSIITITNRIYCIENMINNFLRQNFDTKELIIVINNDSINIEDISTFIEDTSNITIYKLSESISLGTCLNYAIERSKYNYIAKFDDDDYYGPNYLNEVHDAFNNFNCQIVGKYKTYYYLEKYKKLILKKDGSQNCFVSSIMGSTICFKKEIFSKVKFRDISSREDFYFNQDCNKNGFKIYSTSCYNHLVFKHKDPNKHTFISDLNILMSRCNEIKSNIELKDCFNIINNKTNLNS